MSDFLKVQSSEISSIIKHTRISLYIEMSYDLASSGDLDQLLKIQVLNPSRREGSSVAPGKKVRRLWFYPGTLLVGSVLV